MKRLLPGFFGIIAVIGFFVTVESAPNSELRSLSYFVLAVSIPILILSLFWHSLKIRFRRAGFSDDVLTPMSSTYLVEQAAEEDLSWIAEVEVRRFGEDAVPETILRDWYSVNRNGFTIIKAFNGRRVGHLVILAVQPKTLARFLRGDITEKNFLPESLFTPRQKRKVRDLYVESIAASSDSRWSEAHALRALLYQIPNVISRVCDPQQVDNIYAAAATADGKRIMNKLGFDLITGHAERKDRMDLRGTTLQSLISVVEHYLRHKTGQ